MTTPLSPPPLRDLPPGRLERRRQHLLSEIARGRQSDLSFGLLASRRARFIAALAGVGAAAAAAAIVISLSGGPSSHSSQPFLVQGVRGPAWGAYAPNWGGGVNLACATITQTLFGCGGIATLSNAAGAQPTAPTTHAGRKAPIDIVGGTTEQQSLLRSIADNMRTTAVTRIEIRGSGSNVLLRMQAPDTSMRTLWEETLIAGAFRDQAKLAHQASTVSLVNGESSGTIPPGPVTPLPAAKSGDAERTRNTIIDAAGTTSGATLEDLTIYRPSGVAVAVTLKAKDPASFLVHEMPRFLAAIGDLWHDYDGVYVRLLDDSGTTVWETSTAGRTSTGAVGSRADLAGCSPVANWGPTPAPCPAK